jgi:diguanylate cyclase (GGDEF)-like protein
MRDEATSFSLPRWRITRWLADPGTDAPEDIRRALVGSLFGTLPIFAGGVLNSILVAAIIATRLPQAPFLFWVALEVSVCVVRLLVLLRSFKNAREGRDTPTDIYLLLGVAWAGSVGYGAFISLLSGDWVVATLACMSAAAMVGGICFRNFGAPRLSAIMTACSLGPTCLAAPFSGEPILYVAFAQIPFYLMSMRVAAYKLNALLVATMQAEREHEHQARHDALTGLTNRIGLMRAMDEGGDRRTALLYLDLDGFKAVNDAHGHAAGDRLLKQAADRLRHMLRAGDIAARIGGDEFVIVARDVDRAQAPALGERLIHELGAAYDLGQGLVVSVGVSVGVALTPDHGDDVSELLDMADAALYGAKSLGKSRCIVAAPRPRPAVAWDQSRSAGA